MKKLLPALLVPLVLAAEPATRQSPKQALRAFNDLIGSWRAAGDPQQGTREERQKGLWTETIKWQWQFKGDDVCLHTVFDKGKHYSGGELRYLPDKDRYRLTLQTPAKETVAFEGELKGKRLILERSDDARKETQRLTLSFLHPNRYLYR